MYPTLAIKISSDHPRYDKVVDYCFELASLHLDLEWTLDWLGRSYGLISDREPPESQLGLILKKHLIAHTEDDYRFRLYAYQQKVYQLTNAVFPIGEGERSDELRIKVSFWVDENEKKLATRLKFFYEPNTIREMIKDRSALTHRLRPTDFKMLSGIERFFDWVRWDPEMDELANRDVMDVADVAKDTFVIDDHYQKVTKKLEQIQRELSDFGDAFCSDILNSDYLARKDLLRKR